MKIASEIVGIFIISWIMMAIPILCTLSWAYNWFAGLKFILSIICFFEWIGIMSLISNTTDRKD